MKVSSRLELLAEEEKTLRGWIERNIEWIRKDLTVIEKAAKQPARKRLPGLNGQHVVDLAKCIGELAKVRTTINILKEHLNGQD